MLIIGWSLSTDPVGNVFDILGPLASQNTFGFWSDANPNPFYSSLLGVNTLADAQTQALADKVLELGRLARTTFNINDQINYTRWAEGLLADANPVNVLYYRINIEAYSKTNWQGWIPFTGSIWAAGANYFLMSELTPVGISGGVAGATASVNAGLSIPGKVLNGESVSGYVLVIDNKGAPVSGATVAITVTGDSGAPTATVSPVSGTTGATGLVNITLTGTGDGLNTVNVTASKGGVTSAFVTGLIRSVEAVPKTLHLSIEPAKYVMAPAESIDVNVVVTDEAGDPVPAATVNIDVTQLGYGSVDTDSVITDADGMGTIVYTAPPMPETSLNMHLPVSLSMNVSKVGYTVMTEPISNIMVKVDLAPDWRIAAVSSVDRTDLSAANPTSNIVIAATDSEGNPLANENLSISYSNISMVSSPQTYTITNGAGMGLVTVTMNALTDSAALGVTVVNASVVNAAPAAVTLTCVGTTPPAAEMYGGYITYNTTKYLDPLAHMTVTAHVWDSSGTPADGVNASLIVSGTPYGSLVYTDAVVYDSTWDGVGINVVTSADGSNVVTSGPMTDGAIYAESVKPATGDPLPPGGLPITAGTATFEIFGDDVAHVDVIGDIFVVPEGAGFFNGTTAGWQIDGPTTISSGYVIGRSYSMVSTALSISKPVMSWKQTGVDKTTIVATAQDEAGNPVVGRGVYLFQGFFAYPGASDYTIFPTTFSSYFISRSANWWGDDFTGPSPVITDVDGTASVTAISVGARDLVGSVSVKAIIFARTISPGSVSLLTQEMIVELPKQAFITMEPLKSVMEIRKEIVVVKVKATDAAGAPIAGLQIRVTPSAGVVQQATGATDLNGEVVILLDTSTVAGVRAAFITLDAKATGNAYESAIAQMMVAVKNVGPSIAVTNPAVAEKVSGPNVTVTGSAFDVDGIQQVTLKLDSGAVVTVQGTAGDEVWNIDRVFTNVEDGSHSVTVNVTDSLGVFTVSTVTFTSETPTVTVTKKSDTTPWIVAIIGWIVAVIAIVMWMMSRRKASPAAMAPAEPEVQKEEPKL
jgi:hypothetical protein